jgi:hypothetical protein
MAPRKRSRVLLKLFPCKDCPLVVSHKYPAHAFKLEDSAKGHDTLLILKDGKILAKERVRKITPDCRFCEGYHRHVIGH